MLRYFGKVYHLLVKSIRFISVFLFQFVFKILFIFKAFHCHVWSAVGHWCGAGAPCGHEYHRDRSGGHQGNHPRARLPEGISLPLVWQQGSVSRFEDCPARELISAIYSSMACPGGGASTLVPGSAA